jgi:hypothetical protein
MDRNSYHQIKIKQELNWFKLIFTREHGQAG